MGRRCAEGLKGRIGAFGYSGHGKDTLWGRMEKPDRDLGFSVKFVRGFVDSREGL